MRDVPPGERLTTDAGNWGYVTKEVVVEVIIEARVNRVSK